VVALFGDGKITHLPGGIEEYLRRRARDGDQLNGLTATAATDSPAARPASSAADQRAARKDLQRIERRMTALTQRQEKLHAALAEAATDPDRLLTLNAELREVDAEIGTVELAWLEAAELAEG